jgi:putative membrane protein
MSDTILTPGLHKLHKAYIVFFMFKSLGVVITIALASFVYIRQMLGFISEKGMLLSLVCGATFIIMLVLVFLFATISYHRYKWELTESEVHIYKGIIFRKKIRIPFSRINTVDADAKFVERIFGLVSVRFDTAGGSSNKADAMLPMLRLDEAEALKAEIFRHRADTLSNEQAEKAQVGAQPSVVIADLDPLQAIGAVAQEARGVYAGQAADTIPVEYEYRLSSKELLFASIANSHAIISFMILFGIVSGLYGYLQDIGDTVNVDFDIPIYNFAERFFTSADSAVIFITLALILITVFVISYIMAIISKLISLGGFTIQKRGDRIEVKRGLLARKSSSIVTHRVQTLSITQGLFMRIIGYAEVRAETASALSAQGGNQKGQLEDSVIHPFIKLKNLDDFIARTLPEFADRPHQLEALTLKALRRSITRYGIWGLIILGISVFIINRFIELPNLAFIIAAVVWLLIFGIGALKWKGRAISRTNRVLAIRKGALRRRSVYIARPKIQHATKEMNPLQHLAKMATYSVYTAATRDKRNAIKDLTFEKADEYLEWVEPKRRRDAETG